MSDKLSDREKRLIALLSDGHNFCFATMLKAGYSRSTAASQQRRTCAKLPINRAIIKGRIAKGLYVTPDEMALVGKVEKV